MKYYAQFYNLSTGYIKGSSPPHFSPDNVKPIPACGSDSVMMLDGRLSLASMAARARVECKRRGFVGFTIDRGPDDAPFTRSFVVRLPEYVGADDNNNQPAE